MFYKNTSYFEKTFYGVTFKPGEIKEVKGNVNDRFMIPVKDPNNTSKNDKLKQLQKEPSSEKPKEDSKKVSKSKPSDNKDSKDKKEEKVEEVAEQQEAKPSEEASEIVLNK